MSDDIWICLQMRALISEWQAKTGDEWNDPICFLNADTRRKGHEECGPYAPVSGFPEQGDT